MHKILFALLVVFLLSAGGCGDGTGAGSAAVSGAAPVLRDDKIYFFYYDECPYCHVAAHSIQSRYVGLPIELANIHKREGAVLFEACARKFGLGREVGTPLFCMGDKYIMGWPPGAEEMFDAYVKPFIN